MNGSPPSLIPSARRAPSIASPAAPTTSSSRASPTAPGSSPTRRPTDDLVTLHDLSETAAQGDTQIWLGRSIALCEAPRPCRSCPTPPIGGERSCPSPNPVLQLSHGRRHRPGSTPTRHARGALSVRGPMLLNRLGPILLKIDKQRLRTCCASDVPREPLQPHVLLDRMTAHSRERQERSKGPQCGSRSSSASPVTARPVTTVPASSGSPPPAAEDPRAAWCRARLDDVSADLRVAERG